MNLIHVAATLFFCFVFFFNFCQTVNDVNYIVFLPRSEFVAALQLLKGITIKTYMSEIECFVR